MSHRYLFTLQIVPLEVGKTYRELPSHLTLMSRFLSDLPAAKLAKKVQPIFEMRKSLRIQFGQTMQLGPKKLTVHTVTNTPEIAALHNDLLQTLQTLKVHFEYPTFIGSGHKPHVSQRPDVGFVPGSEHVSQTAYLIEIVDSQRLIQKEFKLAA